jgi:hypothetical protein
MSNILNIEVILSDYFRFFPIGADKESLVRFLADLPRADICSDSSTYDFIRESADILSDNDSKFYRADVREQLHILFSAMVTDISDKGMVTKYKSVNFAEWQNRVNVYANFHFIGDKIITEELKLNRFLKRFTLLNDREIDSIGSGFVASRDTDSFLKTVDYFSGNSRKAFRDIYGSEVSTKIVPRGNFKSIHGSCMQATPETMPNDFEVYNRGIKNAWNEIHPCEAYASGDFTIHALVDKESGFPVSRIVTASNGSHGPIYAHSRMAGNALIQAVKAQAGLDVAASESGSLAGLTLLRLVTESGLVATPYMDNSGSNYTYKNGNFVLGSYGSDHGNTSGFIGESDCDDEDDENNFMCEQCNDYFAESDVNYVANGDCICDSCLRHHYTRSDLSGDYYPDSDMTTALNRHGNWIDLSTDEVDDGDFTYCDNMCEYVHINLMITTECGVYICQESSDVVELNGLYYMRDSDELSAAQAIADLLYCQQPVTRDPETEDLFATAA